MISQLAFSLSVVLGLFAIAIGLKRVRDAGAREERERANVENAAHLERQDAVANRPVTDDELQKSLKDGSF